MRVRVAYPDAEVQAAVDRFLRELHELVTEWNVECCAMAAEAKRGRERLRKLSQPNPNTNRRNS
jgi:hypothetical protein